MKKGLVFWFTGLSGSGKTTVAEATKIVIEGSGYAVLIIDGDDVRSRLHIDLGFSPEDIKKNNSLIVQLCETQRCNFDVLLVPIISPYASSRAEARERLTDGFYEIFFSADLNTVMKRDIKGLYKKARNNEINNLIGYSPSNVYEPPLNPDFVVNSAMDTREKSVHEFCSYLMIQLKECS
jgi:adenylyl-sulfate kinase